MGERESRRIKTEIKRKLGKKGVAFERVGTFVSEPHFLSRPALRWPRNGLFE